MNEVCRPQSVSVGLKVSNYQCPSTIPLIFLPTTKDEDPFPRKEIVPIQLRNWKYLAQMQTETSHGATEITTTRRRRRRAKETTHKYMKRQRIEMLLI